MTNLDETSKEQSLSFLREALTKEVFNRGEVSDISTEIRKIIETEKIKSTYPLLWFFCSWCGHHKMSYYKNTRIEILNDLDLVLEKILEKGGGDGDLGSGFIKTLDLNIFQSEMYSFFRKYELPIYIIQIYSRWINFLRAYVEKVKNQPIEGADCGLKHIDKIYIINTVPQEGGRIDIAWRIILNNKKEMNLQGTMNSMQFHNFIEHPNNDQGYKSIILVSNIVKEDNLNDVLFGRQLYTKAFMEMVSSRTDAPQPFYWSFQKTDHTNFIDIYLFSDDSVKDIYMNSFDTKSYHDLIVKICTSEPVVEKLF